MALFSSFIGIGIISARPAFGEPGRLYFATDEGKTYRDSGAAWVDVSNNNASNLTSGTLPSARLPNPSSSTLGGVQSIVAVSHQFLTSISTSGVPVLGQPTEADLSLSDITTNNVSITKHGLAPKAPNDATQFLNGVGTYSTPAGGFSSPLTTKGDVHTYSTADARLAVGTNGQRLVADSTQTTGLSWATDPFLATCYKSGKPDNAEVLVEFIPAVPSSFPTSLPGSTVRIGTNPTATAVYTFSKNGSSFGTLSISTGGTPTWTSASGASFNGTTDYCTITAPTPQDATLAGVGICLKGSHS